MGQRLFVNLKEKSYNIKIERGILSRLGDEIKKIYSGRRVFVLSDENVAALYGARALAALGEAGFEATLFAVKPGEGSKSVETLLSVYDRLLDFGLSRGELVVTLGGGVVGDLGGFAASTYLRGVPFVQVPTSILAQVDSSVGGKVGIDLPRGKNLIGSFHQPKAVLIDPELLTTLPEKFYKDGMAEVIKTACIRDEKFFELLFSLKSRAEVMEHIEEIIYRCCDLKRAVVEADERDLGERMLLNFGHTLGHAIEKYYRFETFSHGEAVAMGMYLITQASERAGITAKGTALRIGAILDQYGLPKNCDMADRKTALDAIALDKKNINGKLNIVLLKEIGQGFITPAPPEFFKDV